MNLSVKLNGRDAGGFREKLHQILHSFRCGATGIRLHYQTSQAIGDIVLGQEWHVNLTDELLRRLEQLAGPGAVNVGYRSRVAN